MLFALITTPCNRQLRRTGGRLKWAGALLITAVGCSSTPAPTPNDADPVDGHAEASELSRSEAGDGTLQCRAPVSCQGDGCALAAWRMAASAVCAHFLTTSYSELQCADGTIVISRVEENLGISSYFRDGQLIAQVLLNSEGPYQCAGPSDFGTPRGCTLTRDFCAEAKDGGAGRDAAD
jgi:hypothetical protein